MFQGVPPKKNLMLGRHGPLLCNFRYLQSSNSGRYTRIPKYLAFHPFNINLGRAAEGALFQFILLLIRHPLESIPQREWQQPPPP